MRTKVSRVGGMDTSVLVGGAGAQVRHEPGMGLLGVGSSNGVCPMKFFFFLTRKISEIFLSSGIGQWCL